MPVNINFTPFKNKIERGAFRGVVAATNIVRNEVLRLMREPKSGRSYAMRGKKRVHIASAPGEAPAVQYGVYARQISAVYDRPSLSGRVNSAGKQAKALEYGTSRMKARPHMRRALLNKKQEIIEKVGSAIRAEISR